MSIAHTSLIDLFLCSAVDAAATAECIPANAEALNLALQRATQGEERVLLALSGDVNPQLFAAFASDPRVITSPVPQQLATVRTGVTDAFAAVASTGSVCIAATETLASQTSMLTRRHIAVVSSDTIVLRPRDVLAEQFHNGAGLRRSFSFITGPSATADMGPLVRGVHGPGSLHIIILD